MTPQSKGGSREGNPATHGAIPVVFTDHDEALSRSEGSARQRTGGGLRRSNDVTTDSAKRTRKTKNRIFAISAVATAMPVKPKMPATIAMMKKTAAQYSIAASSRCLLA